MTKADRPTLAQLVEAAKELQKVLGAKPPLRTTGDKENIIKDLKEAAGLLEPTDEITEETRWVLGQILGESERG